MRIQFEEMKDVFKQILLKKGFDEETADTSAQLFTENSCDGVYSHGVNRFPRVMEYLEKGYIDVKAKPEVISSFGALEKFDGKLGMGNVNAKICMDRAIELAKKYGIGCVALQNTNHWMRGGAYGIQAAKAGCVGICWTNTQPNMPAWGAKDRRIGNNPLVMCIPSENGPVIVDGAMAQFSYGAIESAKLAGKQLAVPGGFDENGEMTTDPVAIEKTWRVLPIGFWKGSGFSMVMDLIASSLSGGNSTTDIGKMTKDEYGLCQMFIAIDVTTVAGKEFLQAKVDDVLADVKDSELTEGTKEILYPGERSSRTRKENLKDGIPVNDQIWEKITSML